MQIIINAALVKTIVAACIGEIGALASIKEIALQGLERGRGLAAIEELQEAGRLEFISLFPHATTPKMGLATMQANKVKGASKFYNYTQAVKALVRKAEAGDINASIKLAGLTTKDLVAKKAPAGKPADKPAADKGTPVTLTVDDAIACIKAAAAAGALTEPQLATLRALTAPAPVKHMGAVVEIQPLALAA